ncbi:MAG: hypothetical protein UY04_C0003G0029 [Parcubacteria group bacterium GW2011_GWA2_47_7]|nr:MAG: hypothetical protein UY04_C0003G0029 [Parcubacteria group bacterium GW2011_GWA2_47_7]
MVSSPALSKRKIEFHDHTGALTRGAYFISDINMMNTEKHASHRGAHTSDFGFV